MALFVISSYTVHYVPMLQKFNVGWEVSDMDGMLMYRSLLESRDYMNAPVVQGCEILKTDFGSIHLARVEHFNLNVVHMICPAWILGRRSVSRDADGNQRFTKARALIAILSPVTSE